jgi:hypothetical protein
MGMSPSTPEPVRTDVAAYLRELTARLNAVLGDRLVAAWLIGSSALDDFDVRRSDIDVQAICAVRPARAELERLAALLSHDALPCPARGLEFVLYARADLADPRGPGFVLNLNTGGAMRHHVGLDPDAEPRFWFTLDVAIARDHARPLAGAPPAAVVPTLPTAPRPSSRSAARGRGRSTAAGCRKARPRRGQRRGWRIPRRWSARLTGAGMRWRPSRRRPTSPRS